MDVQTFRNFRNANARGSAHFLQYPQLRSRNTAFLLHFTKVLTNTAIEHTELFEGPFGLWICYIQFMPLIRQTNPLRMA